MIMMSTYRAYDRINNQMRYDISALEFNGPGNKISGVVFNFDFDELVNDIRNNQFNQSFDFYDMSCIDLMRLTNLVDCEDNEIYEGDIIKSQDGSNGPIRYFVVENDEYNTGFKPMTLEGVGYNQNLCWVVGNIYENKDLLNKVTYL